MKTKLKISKLEVQSFVTSLEKEKIQGGALITLEGCLTGKYPTQDLNACINTIRTVEDCTVSGGYPTIPVKECIIIHMPATNLIDCPPTNDPGFCTLKCEN